MQTLDLEMRKQLLDVEIYSVLQKFDTNGDVKIWSQVETYCARCMT